MNKTVSNILQYLKENKINVKDFTYVDKNNIGSNISNQIVIQCKSNDLEKWSYLCNRINYTNKQSIVNISFSKHLINSIVRIKFRNVNSYNDLEMFENDLNVFFDALKKKYYTVAPQKESQHILIKPTYKCNLDCKYCFDKPNREKIKCDMPMEVLDKILDVASHSVSHLYLSFHGGEPTMVGIKWYENAFQNVISKYPMLSFKFDFVTNGTNLNDEWFNLFKKYNITFCVSYNAGYQTDLRCQNQNNQENEKDRELSNKVEEIIKNNSIGIVDVVTKKNYKNMINTYQFYRNLPNRNSVALNVVNGNSQTSENDLVISAQEYCGEFLKLFKHWLYDVNGINERSCSSTLALVVGSSKYNNCPERDCRGERFTINPLGEIYECDKFLPKKYCCGNIFDIKDFNDIYSTEGYKIYSKEIEERFLNICSKCNYFKFCFGCCPASVIQNHGDGTGLDDFACESLKLNFNSVYDVIRDVDSNNYININPNAKTIMTENGFISIKEIKEMLKIINFDKELEYNPENLFKCSEYEIFSFINHNNNFGPEQKIRRQLKDSKRNCNVTIEQYITTFKLLMDYYKEEKNVNGGYNLEL